MTKKLIGSRSNRTMSNEFYDNLRELVLQINEHPYRNTEYSDYYGCRFSKKNLGVWTDEEYDLLLNGDTETERIIDSSNLDLFIFCERGGFIYVGWN